MVGNKIIIKCLLILSIFAIITENVFALDINPHNHIYKRYDEDMKNKMADNVIEYDEIEDLVHSNNPTIQNNYASYEYGQTSNDVYEDYMEAYDSLISQASSVDSDAMSASLYAQASAMKQLADNNINDSLINFYNYYKTEKETVLETKKLFLEYYKSIYDVYECNEKISELKRNVEKENIYLKSEIGTNLNLLTAKNELINEESNKIIYDNAKTTNGENLKLNCVKSIGETTIIGQKPNFSIYMVYSINREEDKNKAILNNITLAIYERALQNSTTEENKIKYKNLQENAKQYIINDLDTSYSELLNEIDNYKILEESKKLLYDTMNNSKIDYENGLISLNEYKTTVYNYNVIEYQIQKQLLTIEQNYEEYKSKVDGLAKASE